ncbi:MAG: hypothetical protein Q8R36_00225 [bacterium]|nr:hypothetical protein [bacterium]
MRIDPNSHEGRWIKRFALFPKRTREGILVWLCFYYMREVDCNWAGSTWEYALYPNNSEMSGEWRQYFVWLPMKFEDLSVAVDQPHRHQWVWLKWVERRWTPTGWPQGLSSCFIPEDDYIFQYRYDIEKDKQSLEEVAKS